MFPFPTYGVKDHKIPKSRGGRGQGNLVDCCWTCNCRKRDRTVEEYREYLFQKQPIVRLTRSVQQFLSEDDEQADLKSSLLDVLSHLERHTSQIAFYGELPAEWKQEL